MALFDVTETDQRIYTQELQDFVPDEIFDIHSHLWLESFWATPNSGDLRAVTVCEAAGIEKRVRNMSNHS